MSLANDPVVTIGEVREEYRTITGRERDLGMSQYELLLRRLLRLVPEETKIHLWSDMDYGGFNILSQLRKEVGMQVEPFLMDVSTFEKYASLSRPLTQADIRNLKRLALNPRLRDIQPVIEHLVKRGLKLEQEAIENVNQKAA